MKVENTKTLGKAEAAHEGSGSLPLKGKKQKKAAREFCMDRYRQRYIALHLMYLGHNYHGLAAQPHLSETIEVTYFPTPHLPTHDGSNRSCGKYSTICLKRSSSQN